MYFKPKSDGVLNLFNRGHVAPPPSVPFKNVQGPRFAFSNPGNFGKYLTSKLNGYVSIYEEKYVEKIIPINFNVGNDKNPFYYLLLFIFVNYTI